MSSRICLLRTCKQSKEIPLLASELQTTPIRRCLVTNSEGLTAGSVNGDAGIPSEYPLDSVTIVTKLMMMAMFLCQKSCLTLAICFPYLANTVPKTVSLEFGYKYLCLHLIRLIRFSFHNGGGIFCQVSLVTKISRWFALFSLV